MVNKLDYITEKIKGMLEQKEHILIAIDGRCASGKSTLAGQLLTSQLKEQTGCCVIHMDDFFLRPEQRTVKRLQEPGGNVDYERFLEEVMKPLSKNQPFSIRAYNCKTQLFENPVSIKPKRISVIEGSYSCHPSLWEFYDFRIFLTIDKEEQLRRIMRRNGKEAAAMFQEKWIPLEERYFEAYDIEKRCDLRFITS